MGLDDFASRSRHRDIFALWFDGGIVENSEPLYFADTEMAAVSTVMDSIKRGRSIYVFDPLPSNDIPLALCLAFLRSQDTRFPTKGIIGQGKPLLALPALSQGYVTRFDDLKKEGFGKKQPLVNREPIQKLSEIRNGSFYTGKHGFEFDREWPLNYIGAIFVDLRKAEWRKQGRRLDTILGLVDEPTPPIIFYTDKEQSAFSAIREHANEYRVTSELLTTADPTEAARATTLAASYERLLTQSEVTVSTVTYGYPDGGRAIAQLGKMKNDLQELGLMPMEVGWVYNLLTQCPVKPEYWEDTVRGHYYHFAVCDLISNLRGIAQRTEGQAADLLINFIQGINHLQGGLNKSHPVQDALFTAIHEAETEGIDRTIVVKDEFEQQALLHAINMEDSTMPESHASVRVLDDIEPTSTGEAFYARPFGYQAHPYQFPLRPQVTTFQFETWGPTVESQLEAGLAGVEATFDTQTVGETNSSKQSSKRSAEDLRDEYEQQQRSNDINYTGDYSTGPKVRIELSTGETRTVGEHSKFPVYNGSGDIARVKVKDLSEGDTVLLLSVATDDIYELYLDTEYDKEKIRKCEATVEQWRDVLQDALSEDGVSTKSVIQELQKRGATVSSPVTVRFWASGHTIGPDDDSNVERVLDAFQPELKPRAPAILQSMKEIRRTNAEIGQKARRAAEAHMGLNSGTQAPPSVIESIDDVENGVQQVTIQSIDTIDNE